MSEEEFDRIVEEAIDNLPDEFRDALEEIEIVVDEEPSRDQLAKTRTGRRYSLLGLYEGVPLEKRSVFQATHLPDRITLFRRSIEEFCRTREDMVDQIQRTLLHEIGHYFGLNDKRLRELGY